jgi:two-component system NtrC family sensor kinase
MSGLVVQDIRRSDPLRLTDRPDVRQVIWGSVVPVAVCVALAALVFFAVNASSGSRILALTLAGLAASVVASALVAIRLSRQLRELVRQRDGFYEELARLSKLASVGKASCSIAHDLNNPLAIMNEEAGWMQDLLNSTDTDPAVLRQEFTGSVEQLQVQIGRCREITQRTLTWTRDQEGPVGQVDINTLVTKTLYLVENELAATGVRVVKRLDAGVPPVKGSAAELRQVLFHLMKNALDAMRGGGGTLTITTARTGDGVRATISDNGPGMGHEQVARIFEPFFTTKAEEQGTGLGLTISLWIVQRIGGRIDVETTPGLGSAFHVTLPPAATADRLTQIAAGADGGTS